jgi:protein-S-isoprenylcysteine O-methyltransferase Ste14
MFRTVLQLVLWTLLLGVLILWPAGTLDYPGAWILLALYALGGLAMILWLGKHDPRLLCERMAPLWQREQKPWDRVWLTLFVLGFLAWTAFMGFDAARTGFTAVPPWLQAAGVLAILVNAAGTWWTFRENSFAAPVVKIQKDHRVIDTGPYAFVRHPMYASTLFLFIGIPLLLGSRLGLVFAACSSPPSPGAPCMKNAPSLPSSKAMRTMPAACAGGSSRSSGEVSALLQEGLEGGERLEAHMVLDALGVDARRLGADSQGAEEILDDLMALAALLGKARPFLSEEDAAIGTLLDKPLGREPLQHLGDRGLRHAQPLGDIDLARLAAIGNEIGNQLDIVLDQFGAPVMAGLAKALHMGVGIDEGAFGSEAGFGGRH